MKKLRAILVLLLSVALPWSAGATMLENLQCHHDGLGTLMDKAGAMHHDHAAMSQHHQAGEQGCDCAVKCDCQHHCASGAGIGAPGLATPAMAFMSATETTARPYAAWVPSAQDSSPFRPPIAAPPGAA